MERRLLTDEFKCEAVRLARQPGISEAEISRDLEINASYSVNPVARLMQAAGIKAPTSGAGYHANWYRPCIR
ncbi:hypothetical protein SAMN05216315_10669 [Nitrosospira sp. Nsp18]|uniref:hypothetical protein n=1 Tax=Nitrosospira sp. Nsp18 TaxID=1855334 RepID=UPI00088FD0B2|nr:hypothetical protein [Nitrosospira sp. Nsp18]SDA15590.1 hypothetical protein SAMN05216315_10669 [Nitrosospira sp. Nsp18]